MTLTEREREMLKAMIDRGEPLPPRYRLSLFVDAPEVELIWQGKSDDVTNVVLPFQSIEQIDEPRSEPGEQQISLFSFDPHSGRQSGGWANKLIWGDNRLVLSSLKNGPLRREIDEAGGLKVIYVDPPFSAGIDYTIDVPVGDDDDIKATKSPSVVEEFAYRNTWGYGGSSFLAMMYERIRLMHSLLRSDGVLFLRIDHHHGHYVKTILDDIFGKHMFQSEIVVNRIRKNVTGQGRISMPTATDSLFLYFKSDTSSYVHLDKTLDEQRAGYWRRTDDSAGERNPRDRKVFGRILSPPPPASISNSANQPWRE